ncbi:MAG: cytochrome c biogenesis protein [Vicinamibacteria bacterium]|nr:cytochrome c biogenesis protein [Vicinamibacteria bacterium]
MGSRVYLLLTLLFYTGGAVHVLLHAATRRKLLSLTTTTAMLLGFATHTAALALRWNEAGRFPAVGLRDISSFLAWTLVLVFLVMWMRSREDVLGLAVHPTAFLLLVVANLSRPEDKADPYLQSLFLPVHATLAFLGYSALFVAFAMGVLYLIQERELRSRSPHTFYYLIPSLEGCDRTGGRAAAVGFPLLTLAIVTGMFWSAAARGHYWTGDAKEWTAVVAWLIYLAMLVARHRSGWGGRRGAWLGIAGFAAVALTFLWVTVLASPVGAAAAR